jgi:hypothetical protein
MWNSINKNKEQKRWQGKFNLILFASECLFPGFCVVGGWKNIFAKWKNKKLWQLQMKALGGCFSRNDLNEEVIVMKCNVDLGIGEGFGCWFSWHMGGQCWKFIKVWRFLGTSWRWYRLAATGMRLAEDTDSWCLYKTLAEDTGSW